MTTLVSIAQGGSGANNAADARSNLGAAPSAAYDQANSAYGQANAAYAQANSAFSAANNAQVTVYQNSASSITTQRINFVNTATITVSISNDSGNANVALTAVGGAAYDQANAAYSAANGAYAQANGAYLQANGAYAQANGAYAQANIAYGQANAAYGQANLAYEAANNSNLKLGGLVTGTLNVTQDLIVGGNIYLEGNTTFINVATYSVEDPLIFLASNNTLTDSVDIGFMGGKNVSGTFSHTGFARDATDGKWKLFDGLPDNDHIGNVVNFANSYLATLVANVEANSITLVGNTVATQANLTLAHNSANNASNTANGAYGQANGAYAQANGAYGQANGAYASANGAYAQANGAYAQANSAANTVRVSANGSSTLVNKSLNFINTSSVLVTVNDNLDGNANISFTTLSGANSVSSSFTANGVSNTYTMSAFAADANNVLVTIDGVLLTPGTEYTVNGTTLTILYVPANGSKVEVRTITGGGDGGSASLGFVRTSFVGNGSAVNFTLTDAPVNEDNCLVFVDRVFQRNSEYNVSATTLTFVAAPDNGAVIDTFVTQYLASNAAVIKSGDTMTGQLNISSGGLLVTGNVGIGTSNPVTTLTIAKDANNLTDGLSFLNNDANDNTGSSVSFYTAFGAPFATNQLVSRISGFVTNPSSSKDGNIGLYTGTGGSVSERVRVNSSGNVGIGLTNPSTRLQVNGNVRIGSSATGVDDNADYNITSGGQLTINANDGSANNDSFVSLDLRSGHSTNAAVITLRASNFSPLSSFIDMNLNNSSRMRLFANGNVSIGTTTDHAPFSIVSANVSTSIIAANGVFIGQDIGGYQQIQMNANNGAYIDFSNSASVDYKGRIIYFNAENRMEFHTNSAERVYIDSSGNVGIATSNPSARLQINANRTSSTNAIALLLSDGVTGAQTNGVWKSIRSVSNGGSSISEIRFLETDGTNNNTGLAFVTAQAAGTLLERMRINNAGIITTPYQPAFLAKKVTINQAPWSELTGYASQLITSNRSSGFNLTTGRFTAPVAGVYVFHALARGSDGNSAEYVPGFQLWKNGSNYENIDVWGSLGTSYGGSYRSSFGFSITVELAVNDYVAIAYTSTSTNYVWFSGYLLG